LELVNSPLQHLAPSYKTSTQTELLEQMVATSKLSSLTSITQKEQKDKTREV